MTPQKLTIVRTQVRPYKGYDTPKVDHRSNAGSAVQRVWHPNSWPSFERRFGRTKGMTPQKLTSMRCFFVMIFRGNWPHPLKLSTFNPSWFWHDKTNHGMTVLTFKFLSSKRQETSSAYYGMAAHDMSKHELTLSWHTARFHFACLSWLCPKLETQSSMSATVSI